jgi:hypothetical protein
MLIQNVICQNDGEKRGYGKPFCGHVCENW